jgi:hypothetical protein
VASPPGGQAKVRSSIRASHLSPATLALQSAGPTPPRPQPGSLSLLILLTNHSSRAPPSPRLHRLLPSPTAPRLALTEAAPHRTETGAHVAAEASAHAAAETSAHRGRPPSHRDRRSCHGRDGVHGALLGRGAPVLAEVGAVAPPAGGGGPSRRWRWHLSPTAAPEPKEEIPGTRLLVCFLFRDSIDFVFYFQDLDLFLVL